LAHADTYFTRFNIFNYYLLQSTLKDKISKGKKTDNVKYLFLQKEIMGEEPNNKE